MMLFIRANTSIISKLFLILILCEIYIPVFTKEMSAQAEEVSVSAQSLFDLAQKLNDVVARFKLV
jgi:hypothetical protein